MSLWKAFWSIQWHVPVTFKGKIGNLLTVAVLVLFSFNYSLCHHLGWRKGVRISFLSNPWSITQSHLCLYVANLSEASNYSSRNQESKTQEHFFLFQLPGKITVNEAVAKNYSRYFEDRWNHPWVIPCLLCSFVWKSSIALIN